MAVETVARPSAPRRLVTFYGDVVSEMHKVTWPDAAQVRQLSIAVIVLALVIGAIIGILDVILQLLFVRFIPSLFGGG
jgi:preprotein translocase subunit SecE